MEDLKKKNPLALKKKTSPKGQKALLLNIKELILRRKGLGAILQTAARLASSTVSNLTAKLS